jgi:hypothetical protein
MSLLWFVLACYGLTQILVYGSIFNGLRPRHGFLLCGWLSSGTSYVLCTVFGDEGINVKGN